MMYYPNNYYIKKKFSDWDLDNGNYRNYVGGQWEYQGNLQLNICKKYGLTPSMKFLDFGCGCLRGGVKLIDYLEKYNYYGLDVNTALLNAGLEKEIPKYNLNDKIDKNNFIVSDKFEVDVFDVKFDFILAQSVFTHLTLNHYVYFLEKIYDVLNKNGKMLLSFWLCQENSNITYDQHFITERIKTTSHITPPFHYKFSQLVNLSQNKWKIELLEDEHPRLQSFILYTK